jgi:hypothetical protein
MVRRMTLDPAGADEVLAVVRRWAGLPAVAPTTPPAGPRPEGEPFSPA